MNPLLTPPPAGAPCSVCGRPTGGCCTVRAFPVIVLGDSARKIAWSLVERWRAQIERNHHQTLDQLAARGGLSPRELWLAAHAHDTRKLRLITEVDAARWLARAITEHEGSR